MSNIEEQYLDMIQLKTKVIMYKDYTPVGKFIFFFRGHVLEILKLFMYILGLNK